jgi:hypothetical protein
MAEALMVDMAEMAEALTAVEAVAYTSATVLQRVPKIKQN